MNVYGLKRILAKIFFDHFWPFWSAVFKKNQDLLHLPDVPSPHCHATPPPNHDRFGGTHFDCAALRGERVKACEDNDIDADNSGNVVEGSFNERKYSGAKFPGGARGRCAGAYGEQLDQL